LQHKYILLSRHDSGNLTLEVGVRWIRMNLRLNL